MNIINYFKHSVFDPDVYYRRFDLDVPHLQPLAKRVALAALPFVGLYRPAGLPLSIGMGGVRAFSHLQQAFLEGDEKHWGQCSIELGQAALAIASIAVTLFHFTSGLLILTGFDTLHGLVSACQHLLKKEYSRAGEEALQAIISGLYLAFMLTGHLELMVVFALLQASFSLYQAQGEIKEGRYLEAFSKTALSVVRVYQANNYITLIQQRNAFLAFQRTRDIFLKALRAKHPTHLIRSPLSSLKDRIGEKEVILIDAEGGEHSFGSHFHGHGQALVKGENLIFRTYFVDGKEITELDFKVNHVFRKQLTESIAALQKIKPKELHDILLLAGSHAKGISISRSSDSRFDDDNLTQTIAFDGLGKILVGASSEVPNLYDRVVVRMGSEKTLYDLHEMLSFVNLDRAVALSTQDDIERLKIGHLFRIFHPREATPFERTEEFFTLPLDQLKAKIIEKAPGMKDFFASYLPRMKEAEILPGRVRYQVEGLSEAAYEKGARALTAAVTGGYTDEEIFRRTASMLKMGMLATEVRDENNINATGLSPGMDYYMGAADSVFTQMLTEKNVREKMSFDELDYQSKVRFLISLDALNGGSYQYHEGSAGSRIADRKSDDWWWGDRFPYVTRPGILEFVQEEQGARFVNDGHEVMLKERIDPSLFTGLIVPNEKTKTDLLAYLSSCNLVQEGKILGHEADRFIRVGKQVTEEILGL